VDVSKSHFGTKFSFVDYWKFAAIVEPVGGLGGIELGAGRLDRLTCNSLN
jgi:hypothetical protein